MKAEEHVVAADFVANLLSPEAKAAAVEHLAGCAQCREAVEAAAKTAAEAPLRPLPPSGPAALKVLVPRFAARIWRILNFAGRFGIVIGVTGGVLLLPAPEGVSPEGHRALALLAFTASILALEPVALPIGALMVPLVQVGLGIARAGEAFEPFSRPVVFLILSSMFLAEALRKHGLARRLALGTLVATGGQVRRVLFGLMAIAAILSMWVENTATAAMLIPVALTASRQIEDKAAARSFLVLLVLGIAYSASLGGMATVMGSASNAVSAGFLAEIRPWRFMDWMAYGLPALVLIFPLTWWLLLRMAPVSIERLDVERARQALHKQGRMSSFEKEILGVVAVAGVLWVGGEGIEKLGGLSPTLLSASLVGVGAVAYLGIRGIVNWEDVKGVSWGIFLIIGAGLSLGDALIRTGVTVWLAGLVSPVVGGLPLLVSLTLLVLISAVLTNLLSNTTIAAVFVPVLISLAKADPSFSAVQLVLPVALATTFGYSLPSASGRMALIAASGIITRSEMLRYGLLMTLANSAVLVAYFYVLTLLGWI